MFVLWQIRADDGIAVTSEDNPHFTGLFFVCNSAPSGGCKFFVAVARWRCSVIFVPHSIRFHLVCESDIPLFHHIPSTLTIVLFTVT